MRFAYAWMLLAMTACIESPGRSEPESWAAPMPAPTEDSAARPHDGARWTDVAVLRWPAALVDASGIHVEEPCFVEALTDGPRIRRVTAVCGTTLLYDTDRAHYGGPVDGATLLERLLGDGLVHGLAAEHTTAGVRLRVATSEETATIEHTDWLGWSVRLRPVEWSDPRSDPALLVPNTLESRATVLHLAVGDGDARSACRVDVRVTEAFGTALTCAVGVDCDGREVIPPATEGPCTIEGGALASVSIPDETGASRFAWAAVAAKGSIVLDGRAAPLLGNADTTAVPECDTYLSRYRKCLDHFPENARRAMEHTLVTTTRTWKALVDGPARTDLPSLCATEHDHMREAFTSRGC